MLDWQKHRKLKIFIKAICIVLIIAFVSYDLSWAGATEILPFKNLASLPQIPFAPPTLKYLSVNTANPHNYFNFLLDKGQSSVKDKVSLNKEAMQLINYFFLGITLPDNAFWVNLKPQESERITSEELSKTDLGRTLLEQDFRLKRDMSQYLNPQNPIGRQFWEKLYAALGTDKVKKAAITTSNRVWIVPAEAVVVETEDGALLVKSSLKVLLESEYAALKLKAIAQSLDNSLGNNDSLKTLTEQLMKEIIIPAITKDINESPNYAPLRQVYHSLILAQWYKRKYQNADSVYARAINKGSINGLESQLPWERQQIWQEYLKSYKQGEYKIQDTIFGLKRMYFSGGVLFDLGAESFPLTIISQKELPEALKQDPNLLNPDALRNGLVVLTERQGNQEGPLVENVNVVSSPADLDKETTLAQPQEEKTKSTAKASSPVSATPKSSSGIFSGIAVKIKSIIQQIIKSFSKKETKSVSTINIDQPRPQRQVESRQPQMRVPQQTRRMPVAQAGNDLFPRQEIGARLQQLDASVAQASKEALTRSFRPVDPAELPLPIPITMLNQNMPDQEKVVRILENMQRMMDGTDEKVLRDLERAIDNARDRVTEQALEQFDTLSDEGVYQLLTDGYSQELEREFQRIIENQLQHMLRFHAPSPEEQSLYVSDEINEKYPRLPRYLKWLLTNNPQLENDPLVRDWLNTIQMRMSRIPAFPEMMQDYSQRALNKSLYLNPELAMRVVLYLARGKSLDGLSGGQAIARIQQELARNLPEDIVITDVSIDQEEEGILELPSAPQPRSLPAADIEKTDSLKTRLKVLFEEYQDFLARFSEQEALVRKAEADLTELNEGLEEAKKQNDKVIISALQPAVEGLTSNLRKAKENLKRLQQEKFRYEQQIKQLKKELGETASSPLFSFDPIPLLGAGILAVIFLTPLYITKKIINKRYNTTAGKALGLSANFLSNVLTYYTYLRELSPWMEKTFNADWLNCVVFFILWPISIIAGVLAGKLGKGISHERLYWKANSSYQKGDIYKAIPLLDQAVGLKPKDAASYRLLAECYRSPGDYVKPVAYYQKALEIEPTNSATHNNLGVVYAEKGDDIKAIESYQRSLEIEPNDSVVLINIGKALYRRGQLLEAARVLQRAQEINPDDSVTEELNQILRQAKNIPKTQRPADLPYGQTLSESLRIDRDSSWLSQLSENEGFGAVGWLGAIAGWVAGGLFMHYVVYGQHWNLGREGEPNLNCVLIWAAEIVGVPFLGAGVSLGLVWVSEKVTDLLRKAWRFLKYPWDYKKLQKVNLLPSDELSDRDLKKVAPIYARMSKEYLEIIFRSWIEAGQEEKIARLFKFGKWNPNKIQIYADIGEYKKAMRLAAVKFARTQEEEKVVFNKIDQQKDKLTQKLSPAVPNAVSQLKDVLPQIIEYSRTKDEFFSWLDLVIDFPVFLWRWGSKQVLDLLTDLKEFKSAQEEALEKFCVDSREQAKVVQAVNTLKAKLDKEGLSSASILKVVLAEVNKVSENLDEFLFWVNELMQFDKRIWSSGSQLKLLQDLIAYEQAKKQAAKKFSKTPAEISQLLRAVDSLRLELQKQQIAGDIAMLKDVIPQVAAVSRDLLEFLEYIAVLKAFDKHIWYGTQSVLQAFNNHAAYKQARENAAAKFTQDDATRQKFLSDIDTLRTQLVQKGFPQASDLLKDIFPELAKTCRSKEEFIYWLGELVGLNVSIWRLGAQAIINNFNDLAGFKQAKETALARFCLSRQEKDNLAGIIDSSRAKLEEKVPACSGALKDLILRISVEYGVTTPDYSQLNDFIHDFTLCVNFETAIWQAGAKSVLAAYGEFLHYKIQRLRLFSKFAIDTDGKERLSIVWDNLEKSADFSRASAIALLRNAVDKIASIAKSPREFVFWIGTLSELNSEILEVFCRDIDTVFAYYKEKGKTRDFNHLPQVLNQYHKTYHQTLLITANLLDILTDSGMDIDKRVAKASKFIIEQKIVKLGAPPNLVGLRDAVSFEQLLAITGESTFSSILNFHWQEESYDEGYGSSSYDTGHQPIRQIVPKMGQDGMYSYWEAQQPIYYQQFLTETQGLAPGFNRPGEKFRVAYDDRSVSWTKAEEAEVMPITDNTQALKQLIQYLRMEWPNLYENFIEPKRELIKGRPLEEFVTSETVLKMTQQLLGKVQNWQFSEQQRAAFLIKIMEIFAFPQTADLRVRIAGATDDFNKLRLTSQYWERILELTIKQKWLQEKSKFFQGISKIIKQRIAVINDKLGNGGEGVLQFYLSGGTVADFFKGIVSCDCTKPGGQAFQTTIGTIIDPGFFLFKVIENGKWVGNIYSMVFKTKDNKFALFVDVFQINLNHPLVAQSNGGWDKKRQRLTQTFFKEFKSYLASQGFDYLIFANTHSSQKIGSDLHNEIVKESGRSSTETISLKKPGGMGHLAEGGLSVEYVQGTGGNISGDFQNIAGYKIALDKTTPQVMQQKQKDIDYLEKLLREMAVEETRLLNLVKQKEQELQQLARKGREAANAGKNTVALALKAAYDKKRTEIQKIIYESQELGAKREERRQEAERLRSELGIPQPANPQATRLASSPLAKALLSLPAAGLLSLAFSNPVYAQGFSNISHNGLETLLFIGGVFGFLGLLYYLLFKVLPEEQRYEPYYARTYPERVSFRDYQLPEDVKTQLDKVLEKVSPEIQPLIPRKVDIRVPYEAGIARNQSLKALRLLFSVIINRDSILDFLKEQEFYRRFKQRAKELGLADDFDQPAQQYFFSLGKENTQYELRLSERTADDILRGEASGDCTALNATAFYNTIPQFLFDPGVLDFKILQEGKWVGNIYAIVAEKDNKPVLIIDAVQLPVWGRSWLVSVKELADKALEKVMEYASAEGFAQVLMSSFVSNFNLIHEHFSSKYPAQPVEIEKVGGFEHLKGLGLWDDYAARNEYLETFSPQWNYGLKKVKPNNPKQTLLLRKVWERNPNSQEEVSSSPINSSQRSSSSALRFVRGTLKAVIAAGVFFIMLALPNLAHAAKFEVSSSFNPPAIVAVVERGDTLWDITGTAYQGIEDVGQGRYAVQAQWPKIYEANPQIHQRPHNALRPMYPDGASYTDDRHIMVNIRPGDRLVIPGQVNYEAMGLTAPTAQTEIKPPVSQTGTSEVAPVQQPIQQQQELQNLQQQKTQIEQELNQLQQQRQTSQADLENLQRQKAELAQQILELKKQLAGIQEELRQARERIPQNLQSEEARCQALEQETSQLEQKKTQYTQEIAELERQYQQAQEDLNQITAQKQKAGQELEQLRPQSSQAQNQIKDLQAEIQRLEAQKKQHQQELTQLQNQRDDLQKGIEQLNQDKDKLQEELKGLKQQISEAKKMLEEAKQKVQPTWKNIWNSLSWPEKAGIILLFFAGIGAAAGGIVLLRRWKKFKQLEDKINKLQKEGENLEVELEPLRAEKEGLVKIKEDAEKAKLQAQEETQRVADQQAQLEAERKRLQQEAQDLARQREEIEKQKQELVSLEEQKSKVRDVIRQLEIQRDGLKENLALAQQETQEAIRKAKELEEQARAQAQLSQEKLTEEQRGLQAQIDAKREEIAAQAKALEEELKQAQIRHELDMQEIKQQKTRAQSELAGLTAERNDTKAKLKEMDTTVNRLKLAKGALLDNLRDLDGQQKALQLSIASFEEEESRLKAQVDKLKKVEEIKPPVKSFMERVLALRKEVSAVLGEVAPVSDRQISVSLKDQLRKILGSETEIIRAPIQDASQAENIIVKIPAAKGYENLPQIILNAHKDIHDHGYHIGINGRDEFSKTGALDDRAGVVSILQSLRLLEERFASENIPHGDILVIFTDLEESGFRGAYDLKHKYENNLPGYESLFNNTYLMITVDGPLDWETDEFVADKTPFVLAGVYPEGDPRYKAIYNAVANLRYPGSQVPRCPANDGMGDHHVFREIVDKQAGDNLFVVNLRAPHTGSREDYHSNKEKTHIDEQLTPFILWLTESVIQLNKILIDRKAGSAKGQGMFAPEEHAEVNEVILVAQRESRGLLIWGNTQGWRQHKDKYTQDITWAISSLKKYPKLHIPGLGAIDIPGILTASNIILIQPRNNSPPGLVVKSRDSYQIAHSGEALNSIYIDETIYKQLYSFEIAILLAHEAIELCAKQIARRKHIPWTVDLAKQVHSLAEEYEIQIVGRSLNGRGSRFDDRIEELLDFANLRRRVPVQPIPEVAKPEAEESPEPEILIPQSQKAQTAPRNIKRPALDFAEPRPEVVDNLRNLFLGGLFRNTSLDLPARLDNFPPPLAQEIRQAYQLGKVKGMPLDPDFLVALTLFFSKLFPSHANDLAQYMKNLSVYLVDNTRSTYGATLSGNTFYIQRSCIEDLVGYPIRVEEIYQGIGDKDSRICVALFRIIIHEIGSAFFKLSHPANQALEELFLAAISKSRIELSPSAQQEINTVNRTTNLDNMARIDWAQKRSKFLSFDYAKLNLKNLLDALTSGIAPQQEVSILDKSDDTSEPGGIDLTKIEISLKDEKFVSNLNPADLKILRAARALKEGQESLAVLYVHEVRLILKDNILSEKDITQKALLKNLSVQLEQRELLNSEAVEFCHAFQVEEIFSEKKLAMSRIK